MNTPADNDKNVSPDETRFKIAAIGEILWDVFEAGPRFGGAPANFACSAAAITGDRTETYIISAVGQDALGEAAIIELTNRHVGTPFVQRLNYPTGQVNIDLAPSGIATYTFIENCAWDNLLWKPEHAQFAAELDAICFGTLGQRSKLSKSTIRNFVGSAKPKALRIFDVNIRPPFFDRDTVRESLELANVLKLNDEELPLLAEWFKLDGSIIQMLRALAEQFGLRTVAFTRGAHGAIILRDEEVSTCEGVATKVVDTVGAGDAFTAVLAYGLLSGNVLDTINRQACKVASFVCSQSGANPELPARLFESN